MGKIYYYIKVSDEFFKQKEMKKLRKIAGGDTYTIIYLKMLLLAAKQNNKLYFDGIEDNFAEEMAIELDEDPDNVKMTLSFLQKYKLIQIISQDEYELTRCNEVVGHLSDEALRQRRCRERKKQAKLLECDNVTNVSPYIELEKEIEKEIDSKEEINKIIDKYNSIEGISKCMKLTSKRKSNINARLKDYGFNRVMDVLNKVDDSDFLKGCNDRKFKVDIDWVFNPNNFVKILEGKYSNRNPKRMNKQERIINNLEDMF